MSVCQGAKIYLKIFELLNPVKTICQSLNLARCDLYFMGRLCHKNEIIFCILRKEREIEMSKIFKSLSPKCHIHNAREGRKYKAV